MKIWDSVYLSIIIPDSCTKPNSFLCSLKTSLNQSVLFAQRKEHDTFFSMESDTKALPNMADVW